MSHRDETLLLCGGTVYDGTGSPGEEADLLVHGELIAAIGPGLEAPDAARLDAGGLAICPGFIDLHAHADLILALPASERRRLQRGKIFQGITTEIEGNCGLGAAPVTPESRDAIRGVLAWMTPEGVAWRWSGFAEYADTLAASPLPLNAGLLAAHGPIRAAALGMGASRASARDRARMRGLVSEALDAGAFGLSAGLIYPPGMYADTDELTDLARPLARAGALFTAHIRGSSETLLPAVEELIAIGRAAGCAVHHSHSEAVGPAHWSKIPEVLALEDRARRSGARVTFDLFPYHAAATMMLAIYPPWALEEGPAGLLARLAHTGERARMRADIETRIPAWPPWEAGGWPHNLVGACGYGRIFVARTGGRTGGRFDGFSLDALGAARGQHPFDAVSDLMIEEQGDVGQWIFGISGEDDHDEPLTTLLASPHGAIATDACDYGKGKPHPAAYGTFPRIFKRYVRERPLLGSSEAIRRMTSLPASILGLADRGRLAAGLAADIVAFDPGTIGDAATFEEPRMAAVGVRHVLVNGVPAMRDGALTGIDAGRLLRRR